MKWTFSIAILVYLISPSPVQARTWYILPDGTGDAPTIQAGIDSASSGDVVELADGLFLGDGNRDIDVVAKALTVRSQSGNPSLCIIDCQATEEDLHRGFSFGSNTTPQSVLEGITVTNGINIGGSAIGISFGSPTIRNCILINNDSYAEAGAISCAASNALIENCAFIRNRGDFSTGLDIFSWSNVVVRGCTFIGNSTYQEGGCLHVGNSAATIQNCTFYGTDSNCTIEVIFANVIIENTIIAFNSGFPVRCVDQGVAMLFCCDIFGNEEGDWVGCIADQFFINGNFSAEPCFCDPYYDNFQMCSDSWCLPENNLWGCTELVGALGQGCGDCSCPFPVPAVRKSWGSVKALYR